MDCSAALPIDNIDVSPTSNDCYSKLSEVLSCFINHEDFSFYYEFVSEDNNLNPITIKKYILHSQQWPIHPTKTIPSTTWVHELIFYIPKEIKHSKALLYVGGGRNKNKEGENQFLTSKENLNYTNIANHNQAIVIELRNVPNQYLRMDEQFKQEDQILAYTYKMVMQSPLDNAYLAGHLPMAKAIIKAMDAIQSIIKHEYKHDITEFVLTGASKRGWAVWLAALEDDRVKAIVPIVVDILNTAKSIVHICTSFKDGCPYALEDYKKEGITQQLKSAAFEDLMKIEDPFNYLNSEYDPKYKTRFAIPKYIINASGDNFFVPDSSKWYFKDLPGADNYIRYLPNAMHNFAGNFISDGTKSLVSINQALDAYFYFILQNTALPKVSWTFHANTIELGTSQTPDTVKLWVSHNAEERDFRLLSSHSDLHLLWKKLKSFVSEDLSDNRYIEQRIPFNCTENIFCNIKIPIPAHDKGWQASFVELEFNINGHPFITTSEVKITPDIMPIAWEDTLIAPQV